MSGYDSRGEAELEATTTPGRDAKRRRPIVYGEVLFDRFPDAEVLGGAPFNVAWHLQGFGESPLLVSRVGADTPGRRILDAMRDWGLSTDGVAVDPDAPTGLVDVRITDRGHAFEILPNRAYDRITPGQVAAGTRAPLLVHGTLALRTETGRETLRSLHEATGAPLFCDMNLRPPWDADAALAWSLENAAWLKLNDEELARMTGRPCGDENACVEGARELLARQRACAAFVTRGEEGAMIVHRDGAVHRCAAPPVDAFVDSVGAGDAFTSVAILGLLRDWSPRSMLERALAFAARICAQRGATSADPEIYAGLQRSGGHGA